MLIGRIERGFDFLGCHFGRARLRVAKQTVANFIEKGPQFKTNAIRSEGPGDWET